MENYFLEKTPKSPGIDAKTSGEILVHGICMPEDVQEYFQGFFSWLNAYHNSPAEKTELTIKLAYFNTSTTAMLLKIFRSVSVLKVAGKKVVINWYHEEEDSDIKESGQNFARLVDVEFNIIPYTN